MDQIPDILSDSFIVIYLNDIVPHLDDSEDWKSKIEQLKSNADFNSKTSNQIIALISYQIETICLKEKLDLNNSLNLLAKLSYLYSRAFESKIGGVADVFKLLVTNYNNNRN